MIFKIFIAYLVLHLVSASPEEDSNSADLKLHERAPIPGALGPMPEIAAASTKGLHLSVTTGTPGVWYPGTGAPFNPQNPVNYWTASDSTGQFPSAAAENGFVYISNDYGVTWSGRGASRAHTSITSDASGNRLAVTVNNEGVYLSSDRGITWTLANITDASSYTWTEIASDYSGQYLTAFGSNAGFIYYSHDYGATWTATANPCNFVVRSSAVSNNGQYQYASFRDSYRTVRSTNYGATWTEMTGLGWARSVACNGNGQRLVAVREEDVWIVGSTDYGNTWTRFTNYPVGSWVTYSSVVMDTSGLNIVVGGWDLRAVIGSADGGETWSYITPKGGDFETTWPHRLVGDAAANHLLIAHGLKTTMNPLVTPALPGFTPTINPSKTPTFRPTSPSAIPTSKPTVRPSISMDPSTMPTAEPTAGPSFTPSPTAESTLRPTTTPTTKPTAKPTVVPLSLRKYEFVDDAQFFLVPASVTSIKVTIFAGSGGNNTRFYETGGKPGKGGMISSYIPVTPGEVLMVMVGSVGNDEGGFNGGGAGSVYSAYGCGGGGGATDIRRSPYALTDRVLIAGAGGGAGGETASAAGGNGGLNATRGEPPHEFYRQDDTAMPGGNHLQEPICADKNPGPLGEGCDATGEQLGGGGGGGYYGGGASTWHGGGGGGSSFSLYDVLDEAAGVNTGDGYAVLEWEIYPSPSAAPSLLPVPSPTMQSGVCPSGTILLSNQCAVCPAGTYAGPGFAQCMPCPAGTYSGAWAATCQVSPAGFFSLGGVAQPSMCPAGTVSEAGASSCTACPVGQYSYPGTAICLSCASSA